VKELTKAQKETLLEKVKTLNIVQAQVNDFLTYLRKEHEVDTSWQIKKDLSGFEKIEKKDK